MTLDEVKKQLEEYFKYLEYDSVLKFDGDDELYDAVLTMFSILDYAKLLFDKFGSLEAALEAESVVHCRECIRYNTEKHYCDRPCMGKLFCHPDYYCGAGLTRTWVERAADKLNEIGMVNVISPAELRAALERSKKEQLWALPKHGEE